MIITKVYGWLQVCDELYPISVVEDIAENQPEWSSDDYIEPLEGQSYDQEYVFAFSTPKGAFIWVSINQTKTVALTCHNC